MVISIRAQRVNRGFTQSEIAAQMGISVSKYHKLETAPRSMRLTDLELLAGALKVEPRDILVAALSSETGVQDEEGGHVEHD